MTVLVFLAVGVLAAALVEGTVDAPWPTAITGVLAGWVLAMCWLAFEVWRAPLLPELEPWEGEDVVIALDDVGDDAGAVVFEFPGRS